MVTGFVSLMLFLRSAISRSRTQDLLRQPILDCVRPDIRAETVVADEELLAVLSSRAGPVKVRANQRL